MDVTFIARLLSPLGSYPEQTFSTESEALCVSPDLCFSIVRERGEQHFSEIDHVSPQEVPLFAAMFLCGDKEQGFLLPYPTQYFVTVPASVGQSLKDDNLVSEAGALLRYEITQCGFEELSADSMLHKPRCLGGQSYCLIPIKDQDENRKTVMRFFESAEPVYIRGAASLLKANVAWHYSDFREAACIHLWIALDAAFSIVRKRLQAAGNGNPTAEDAEAFVDQVYGAESTGQKFFERDYYNRIETIHPENRYSSVARPMLLTDDFLHLNDDLIDLYYFFVTGAVRDSGP